MAQRKVSSASSSKSSAARPASPQRRWVVLGSLVGTLALTSALLLALSPAPLTPTPALTLMNVDAPLQQVVSPPTPAAPWTTILVHYGRPDDVAGSAGDHFILQDSAAGTQIACSDRWMNQQPALPPAGARAIDPGCISIRVATDSATIPARLVNDCQALSRALQQRFAIPSEHVWTLPPTRPAAAE